MSRPRIPDNVGNTIELIWAADPNHSAIDVFNEFHRYHREQKISIRKVQQIVTELKKNYRPRNYSPVEWRPWKNESESSEDTAYLLVLDVVKMTCFGRHLYQHEARWGRRIRHALDGLDPLQQSAFVTEYARRERAQFILKRDHAYTSDLDGILAYQPWVAGHQHVYKAAVEAGLIEPSFGRGWQDFVQGLWKGNAYTTQFPETGKISPTP